MNKVNIIVLCLVTPLLSCAGTTQTKHLLQKNPSITMSSQELRVRVRGLARPLAGILEKTADEIMEQSTDPELRQQVLQTKTEVIPAIFEALFRKDPGAALIDATALVEQFRQEFTDGSNMVLDDEAKQIVLRAADDMKQRLQSVYLATGASQEDIDLFWIQVEEWARRHPIEGNFAVRDSTGSLLAKSNAATGGGLGAAISSAQDDLADLAARADIYAEHLPRQGRWQAQLLIEEMMVERIVARAVEQVGPIPLSIERIPVDLEAGRQALIEDIRREGLLVGQWIRAERVESLGFVSAERQVILDHLTQERTIVLEAITGERDALVEALDHQRAVAFEDLESIVSSALVQSRQDLIDHFFLRAAQLLAVVLPLLLIGGLILVWFARRGR